MVHPIHQRHVATAYDITEIKISTTKTEVAYFMFLRNSELVMEHSVA